MKIGIVGAGIMGRVLAFELLHQGHKISIFDRDPSESGTAAAYTAAGMLAPYTEIESADLLIYQLGMRSLRLWPEIVSRLAVDIGFFQRGSLVVAHGSDKSDLMRFNQQLSYKLDNQIQADNQSQVNNQSASAISQSQLVELEPELATNFSQATYLPDEAWLCPTRAMRALANYSLENGVDWHAEMPIEKVQAHKIITSQQSLEFDWVIDCRGLGAKPELADLRGVRGELIMLQAPQVKINRLIRLMHPRYRLYLVPKMQDDIYTIGATQIESQDMGPISVRSTLELLSAAFSLHAGFGEAKIIQTKTNCRPAFKNNLPKIDYAPGLIRINGLFRHGFLLAPALAQHTLQLLHENLPSHSIISEQLLCNTEVSKSCRI